MFVYVNAITILIESFLFSHLGFIFLLDFNSSSYGQNETCVCQAEKHSRDAGSAIIPNDVTTAPPCTVRVYWGGKSKETESRGTEACAGDGTSTS